MARAPKKKPATGSPQLRLTDRFNSRFLDHYAGAIIADPVTALVELVANCWDAYATVVDISWPSDKALFCIVDNGHGMTAAEFGKRWTEFDYNRIEAEGEFISPPPDITAAVSGKKRRVYGRNGKGRHAAFCFCPVYTVRTWKAGIESTFRVSRSADGKRLVDYECLGTREVARHSHGTEITATIPQQIELTPARAREAIGTRFLVDINFEVSVDGKTIIFEDLPSRCVKEEKIYVPDCDASVVCKIIDPGEPAKTTRQKGLAWRVDGRLVGDCTWEGLDGHKLLDGRSHDAKRYSIVMLADPLRKAVKDDWTGFDQRISLWQTAVPVLMDAIGKMLDKLADDRKKERKEQVLRRLAATAQEMRPLGRERWLLFVGEMVKNCPSLSENDLVSLATIMANLESAHSQYGLLQRLRRLNPDRLDDLTNILTDWSIESAKVVLDQIQERILLISELKQKMFLASTHEVHELQPLIEQSLWMFGPEFESVEYTSNEGMTKVISMLKGRNGQLASEVLNVQGSRKRPDFVVLPESSISVYGRPGYDVTGHCIETERVVIVELKRPGISIGRAHRDQAEEYVVELNAKGCLQGVRFVDAFVMGERIDEDYAARTTRAVGPATMQLIPMRYDLLVQQAERRMMDLYRKVKSAPFLRTEDIEAFDDPAAGEQQQILALNPQPSRERTAI